jgi:brefeldin A-inhibited guanine nucleotide-exchange protein
VDVDFPNAIVKCAAQLIIIQSVKDLALMHAIQNSSREQVHYLAQMPPEYRNRWLRCLYASYLFARDFNANHDLRHALWKSGYVQQMPNLTKQETLSLSVFLSILYDLYHTLGDEDPDLLPPLVEESSRVLERFVAVMSGDEAVQNQQRELNNWSPLVVTVLRELSRIPWEESRGITDADSAGFNEVDPLDKPINGDAPPIDPSAANARNYEESLRQGEVRSRATRWYGLRKQIPDFYRLCLKMIGVDRVDVRVAMQEFFEKVGNEFVRVD